ncbi:hypothetical protein A2X44_01270 [candidate division CPR3 bacterium GWF2_35_18]|uniref:Polysaccharide biosynthesis protein n=1 Tax=candidate division CPR3 bacterium GW2011_GWF2_35_18 TaxID=1618350 RepID=A0A0G0BLE7_UNCC3|nr:MAG: Polysaccharide biosynthesis protein [candidate division CPR3 bacterium GW2011_GWF2_35_18]OGB63532.1 MAG: hypothetical protein A2X44_01270 [candidate division CPR3 bacterium GWF2_35_18]OGB64641.1 MAG: hypothetical protein A2250_03820 [candidate division CPR3 bacterium RIFOXYA2_FULL_35_13]OGB76647.1 MAG: hypothetical protein A2476_04075 [candidate division CPR3 bacterium RIFOXYC2_FULL_35_7]
MSVSKRVFNNSTILLLTNVIGKVALALVGIIIARKLGSGELGKLAYAASVIAILDSISTFGLNIFTIRQIPKIEIDKVNNYQSQIFTLRFLVNFIFTLLFFLYTQIFILDGTIRVLFNVLNFASLINVYSSHWIILYRVKENMKYEGILRIFDSVFYGLIGIVLVLNGFGVTYLVYTMFGISIIKALFCHFTLRKETNYSIRFVFGRVDWINIMRGTFPFALMTIIGIIYYRVDTIFIEIFLGLSFVGFYSASYKIMETFKIIPEILSTTVFPTLSQNLYKNSPLVLKSTNQLLKWLNVFAFPLAVGGTLLADKGILFLYGDQFAPAIVVMQILIWALIPLFNSAITSAIINASKTPVINLYLAIANLVINVSLNLILIPVIGIKGAAIATVANESVGFILGYLYINHSIFRLDISKEVLKIIFASSMMGLLIIFTGRNLILIPAYIIVYFIIVFIIKLFNPEDWLILKKITPNFIRNRLIPLKEGL